MENIETQVPIDDKQQRAEKEEKVKKRQEVEAYKQELKDYEKLGALKFQDVVFKVEKIKFKVLKKVCPNFITYFDKYIDWKKNKKIKSTKRKIGRREKISLKTPQLLKYYDKLESLKRRNKLKKEEIKDNFRKKIKASYPKLLEFYDKYLKDIDPYEGLDPKEQIDMAISLSKISKMAIRKEFYQEKNANYHMDPKRPTSMKKYLEWNKKIHVRGLIGNALAIPVLLIALGLGFVPAIPLLVIELASVGINFECINIQNYNLTRFKIKEESLKKQEQFKRAKNIKKYGEASKIIYKSIATNEDLPSFSQIISEMTTKEQALQLRELIKKATAEKTAEMNRRNMKCQH